MLSGKRSVTGFVGLSHWGLLSAIIALLLSCTSPQTTLTQLDEARALGAELRVQLNKAADAGNRAVMADTDEASIAFAKESQAALQLVERDTARLTPLLEALKLSTEARNLSDFKTHLAEYQALEQKILALAVENTNLKAQALSFGGARQAADELRDALGKLSAVIPGKDQCKAMELVSQSVTAVREIQVLQAPHIAERDDEAMTKIEKQMAELSASARQALQSLAELTPTSAAPTLASARTALDKFDGISRQIVALSRRNTNVLSLDLALRKKPALTAACDERLSALQSQLAKEGTKATR